ncbi:hypothetical protein N9H37_03305 [Congregibacter sp.]|nr:hypothetical protein [Congregibacter sp.]MDA8962361.1 hypothetical protein [Congregibacter sp.]
MKKNIVFPYRQIRDGSNAVEVSDWYYSSSSQGDDISWLPSGTGLGDWSYDMPLRIGRELTIDADRLLEELDLSDSHAQFELVHIVKIGNLGMRDLLHREVVRPEGIFKARFEKQLDSSSLCEQLILTSSLTLHSNVDNVPSWAPSSKGSVCWSDETKITLEGHGSRFPMRDISFAKNPRLPANANWHLEWNPSLLHYSFNSAVTLYLNSDKPEFLSKMQDGDEILVEELMAAIINEICGFLLADDDFVSGEQEYPDGTLGGVAKTWLSHALPRQGLASIRDTYIRAPNQIHTALRGLTALV